MDSLAYVFHDLLKPKLCSSSSSRDAWWCGGTFLVQKCLVPLSVDTSFKQVKVTSLLSLSLSLLAAPPKALLQAKCTIPYLEDRLAMIFSVSSGYASSSSLLSWAAAWERDLRLSLSTGSTLKRFWILFIESMTSMEKDSSILLRVRCSGTRFYHCATINMTKELTGEVKVGPGRLTRDGGFRTVQST